MQRHLAELQATAAKRNEVTVDRIIAELEAARLGATAVQQFSAAVAASMGKAKICGLIVDRQELRAEVLRRPVVDPEAPEEMSIEDWSSKYGGTLIEHKP